MSEVMKAEHYYYYASDLQFGKNCQGQSMHLLLKLCIESMFYHLDYFIEGEAEF